jgi:hypothetical protein
MPTSFAWERKKMPVSLHKVAIAFAFLLLALIVAGASYADATLNPEPAPLSKLVKVGERQFKVTAADWVSLDATSSTTVRKIRFGRVTDVSVATTPTGTYSSDGMVSPYLRYPGITSRPVPMRHTEASAMWHPVPGTRLYTFGGIPQGVRIINIQ